MLSKITDIITDEVLFEKIQAGDVKAFDVLFMRYYPLLCAYAKQFVDFDDGQEIVQDVMVWFWENSSMQVIESSPKNYLFRAVKNRCLTLINRNELKQRVVSSMYENQQSQYEDPDFYIVEELTRNIENALSRLPETYREAFEMNRFQSMTYNEIAEKLNVSSKTVDYRIQQALKLLRVELKDYLPLLMALVRIV
ncbi:RNA polymerase sigma-70 factor [Parabacteroides gordonii]|jgi:RNA polymerase sigma-70 factor (family 1)|uniref:RNA polymerase sigma-70 factor n=1 Tax=Parabacteroides gordonii MS-1 = DSM 23371 TaxID=1203610 RepID=A0A0F5JCP3_9BACT|nr:RNA polymerase sigma-70 factor [Parabacteroides gordonii]KKB55621.1 RNA polymerase sigma-70 factor [Parabacteroides gordonii MS-1 = DSM 23371]MCA5581592.1 RNA polymerase sigma-70 factor [Parabacteroides gordonii]RGP18152.1 RNA polymerase sigma-70 factor [Parabacteroides gordonii]